MNKLLTIVLALALLCPPASAKDQKDSEKKTEQVKKEKKSKKKKGKKDQPQQPQPQAKPQPKPSVERSGMFRVTKVEQDWFFEIPDSLIGRDFLTTTRYTSTPSGSLRSETRTAPPMSTVSCRWTAKAFWRWPRPGTPAMWHLSTK